VLLWKGELSAALEEMKQETDETWRLEGEALVHSAMHRRAKSDKALAELIAKFQKESPYVIATVYGYRGEADLAFQWLERAQVSVIRRSPASSLMHCLVRSGPSRVMRRCCKGPGCRCSGRSLECMARFSTITSDTL
jgi:hypothetical protein